MARQVIVGQQQLECSSAVQSRQSFKGSIRQVITIRVTTDYENAKNTFSAENLKWCIRTDDGLYDHSDYNILGDITDHLDGTISVKLGLKYTQEEQLSQQVTDLKADVENKNTYIAEIAGEPISTEEDVQTLRKNIENLFSLSAASLSTEDKITMRSLCPLWVPGTYAVGDVYRTESDEDASLNQIWECIQAYNNDTYPDIIPTNKSTWGTFNKPYHGTTIDTALPYVAPTGAHDIYKSGEYMIWTDGKVKKCVQDTNYSPEEYAAAWEDAEVA